MTPAESCQITCVDGFDVEGDWSLVGGYNAFQTLDSAIVSCKYNSGYCKYTTWSTAAVDPTLPVSRPACVGGGGHGHAAVAAIVDVGAYVVVGGY